MQCAAPCIASRDTQARCILCKNGKCHLLYSLRTAATGAGADPQFVTKGSAAFGCPCARVRNVDSSDREMHVAGPGACAAHRM